MNGNICLRHHLAFIKHAVLPEITLCCNKVEFCSEKRQMGGGDPFTVATDPPFRFGEF